MRATTWLLGVVSVGLLIASCTGQEFGGADPNGSEAGDAAVADGGDDVSGGGKTGGTGTGARPNGGHAGSSSTGGSDIDAAGTPGVVGSSGTGTGSGGSPDVDECNAVPPELPGDCQKLVCSMGTWSSQVDGNDKPEPRGPCDVPVCNGGEPAFESDPAQCQINESCHDGQCGCAGCPNGKVPALSSTLCRMPGQTSAIANKTYQQSVASRTIDGDAQTSWNSGAKDGVLTLTPAAPQAMTALAMWLTGLADNTVASNQKYISVHASVETAEGAVVNKAGNFSFAEMSTGALRLELGLVKAKKLTLTFESPSTFIAVNEVIFEICAEQ